MADDLSVEALAESMPGRPVRSYPALLSTEADALAWARAGGPAGAVVVADYQASPRGRGGWPWTVTPGATLAFSLILRPGLPAHREGWVYVPAVAGVADGLGDDARIEWPDQILRGDRRAGAVGAHVELAGPRAAWAVLNVLVADARPPRGPLLAAIVEAIEARQRRPSGDVLAEYLARCTTIGRTVRARLVPLGPSGPEYTGTALTALKDGALVLETGGGRVAIRPQALALLDEPLP